KIKVCFCDFSFSEHGEADKPRQPEGGSSGCETLYSLDRVTECLNPGFLTLFVRKKAFVEEEIKPDVLSYQECVDDGSLPDKGNICKECKSDRCGQYQKGAIVEGLDVPPFPAGALT